MPTGLLNRGVLAARWRAGGHRGTSKALLVEVEHNQAVHEPAVIPWVTPCSGTWPKGCNPSRVLCPTRARQGAPGRLPVVGGGCECRRLWGQAGLGDADYRTKKMGSRAFTKRSTHSCAAGGRSMN